jgi:aryl-alcohol dehydrogenase-like predicted oxidoreductase
MQNHYNLIYREEEREMLPLCREEGIGVIPWSPLARGFWGNRRPRGLRRYDPRQDRRRTRRRCTTSHRDFDVVDRITEVARQRGVSNAQVALAWILQQPGVTAPIIGASKMQHLDDAVAALELKLDDAELKALAEPYQPHRGAGPRLPSWR